MHTALPAVKERAIEWSNWDKTAGYFKRKSFIADTHQVDRMLALLYDVMYSDNGITNVLAHRRRNSTDAYTRKRLRLIQAAMMTESVGSPVLTVLDVKAKELLSDDEKDGKIEKGKQSVIKQHGLQPGF